MTCPRGYQGGSLFNQKTTEVLWWGKYKDPEKSVGEKDLEGAGRGRPS